jgi:hypothetical protein
VVLVDAHQAVGGDLDDEGLGPGGRDVHQDLRLRLRDARKALNLTAIRAARPTSLMKSLDKSPTISPTVAPKTLRMPTSFIRPEIWPSRG